MTDFVIAESTGRSIWNFYESAEAAESFLSANAEKLAKEYPAGCRVMTYGAFAQLERDRLLSDPLTEISESRYWEMLEVLPPESWERLGDLETFNLCEYTCNTFTAQFARLGTRYFTRTVDARRRETWIKESEIRALILESNK